MKTSKFAPEAEHNGIKMKLIGCWSDLAAYYQGDDGNAWSFGNLAGYGGNWSCKGDAAQFRSDLAAGKYRGQLVEGRQ